MIKLKMLEFAEDYNVCHIFEKSLLLSNQNVSMNEMGGISIRNKTDMYYLRRGNFEN